MLILAGVSLNAIIGDNGIITKAQEANVQNSIAMLEEYLQLKYTENYEEMAKYQSKIEGLTNVFSDYFYIPSQEGVGSLRYVIDSEGHALYLVKKSGLPEEIKESLIGGDAGEGSYADYQSLNDVYGVTSNLKVYYCSRGADSMKGLAKENLDNDNPKRVVFETDSSMLGVLKDYDNDGDGIITAEETKQVKKLTISSDAGITSLSDLYNLTNLQELTLEDLTLTNMDGVEFTSLLRYIFLKNCVVDNYNAIGKMGKKLQYLYFYDIDDNEMRKICDSTKGIANYELGNLQYFAVVGNLNYICSVENRYDISKSASKFISTIEPLKNLNPVTRNAIKYLSLQCNDLTSIADLDVFENLYLVRIEGNQIKTLGECVNGKWNGLYNANDLAYLYANSNNLGVEEIYELENETGKNTQKDSLACLENKQQLYYLRLTSNVNLKWVEYLENLNSLRYLYLDECLELVNVSKLKNVLNNCGGNQLIDKKYSIALLDENTKSLDLTGYELTLNTFESLKNCKDLYRLNLENLVLTDNNGGVISDETKNKKINEVLSELKEMKFLKLKGISALTEISFVGENKVTKLYELDLRGTKVKNLSALNTYALGLKSLILDYAETDLTLIQDVINNFTTSAWAGIDSNCWNSDANLTLCNNDLYTKLNECTSIENLYFLHHESRPSSYDFHSMSSLSTLFLSAGSSNIWLPANLVNFTSIEGGYGIISFNDPTKNIGANEGGIIGDKLKTLSVESFYESDMEKLKNTWRFLRGTSLSSIRLGEVGFGKRVFSNMVSLGVDASKTISLTVYGWSADRVRACESLDGIENYTNLESLSLTNGTISNISGLNNLKKLKILIMTNNRVSNISELESLTSLTELYLGDNQISNLYALRGLKNLTYLNLVNNVIEDNAYNLEGERFNNLSIIAGLHPNNGGKLSKLYLSKNDAIIDFTPVSSLTWTDWSGFNGK